MQGGLSRVELKGAGGGYFVIQLGQLTSGMFRGKTGVTMGEAGHIG